MGSQARKKSQQKQIVLSLLKNEGSVKTGDVASILNVSECTVRRLFDELEMSGEVARKYGGINLVQKNPLDYYFEKLQQQQTEQKERIGKYASTMVESGDNVWIDSGTTSEQMAKHLLERIKHRRVANVQIFSNSHRNIDMFVDYCEVNLIGGLFRKSRQDYCGYLTEMVLDTISFDKAFLGADGISPNIEEGIMTMDVFSAKICNSVIKRSNSAYLLIDSTKLSRRSLIKFATLDQITDIITDNEASEEELDRIRTVGTRIVAV